MRRARTSVPLSVALCTLMALLYASCSGTDPGQEAHDDTRAAHWGYGAEDGPAQWASMSSEWSLCGAGLEQSPIDLVNPSPIELPPVEIDLPGDQEVEVMNQEGVIDALDNGHTEHCPPTGPHYIRIPDIYARVTDQERVRVNGICSAEDRAEVAWLLDGFGNHDQRRLTQLQVIQRGIRDWEDRQPTVRIFPV